MDFENAGKPLFQAISPARLKESLALIAEPTAIDRLVVHPDGFLARFAMPPLDPHLGNLQSQLELNNHLALAHRLALPLARDLLGLPQDHGFAIVRLDAAIRPIAVDHHHEIAMRMEVADKRGGTVTAIRVVYEARQPGLKVQVETQFQLLPAALVGFLRRSRQFANFASTPIRSGQSALHSLGPDRLRFVPTEADRLVDGERVDHVPALVLIDRAIAAFNFSHPERTPNGLTASFTSYADPRLPVEIMLVSSFEAQLIQNEVKIALICRCC